MATKTLCNGQKIPSVGFGTWKLPAEGTAEAVYKALLAGYRHVDTAFAYQNEVAVGQGIQRAIDEGVVTREDVFVTTKLWNIFHRSDLVRKGFQESLDNLKMSYVDLFLIHWPVAFKEDGPRFPKPPGKIEFSDADYVDTYKELEKLVDEGLAKAIGFSNFNANQMQRVLDVCRVKPTVLQAECHPRLNQQPLVDWCKEKGILLTAYSPLGSPDRPWAPENEDLLIDDPVVKKIATKYGRTPAQILLRYPLQRGLAVVAKSSSPARMAENLKVDFELSTEDMELLNGLNTGIRALELQRWKDSPFYPF